jgi:hypothetical protein
MQCQAERRGDRRARHVLHELLEEPRRLPSTTQTRELVFSCGLAAFSGFASVRRLIGATLSIRSLLAAASSANGRPTRGREDADRPAASRSAARSSTSREGGCVRACRSRGVAGEPRREVRYQRRARLDEAPHPPWTTHNRQGSARGAEPSRGRPEVYGECSSTDGVGESAVPLTATSLSSDTE